MTHVTPGASTQRVLHARARKDFLGTGSYPSYASSGASCSQNDRDQALEPDGYRLRSRLLNRDLWLVRDKVVADELLGEIEQAGETLPVITYSEIPILCTYRSAKSMNLVLDAIGILGARLIQ